MHYSRKGLRYGMSKTIPHFGHIVGQNIAKERLTNSVLSAQNGGTVTSPLLIGEAGLGKSAMMDAYGDALEESGFKVIRHKSPEEFRSKGESFDVIRQTILEGGKWALMIDEGHLFKHRPTVQMDMIFGFLLKALEKQNGSAIRFGEDAVYFNRSENVVCLATNFPRVLDKSGAFQSRCDTVILDKYTHEELVQILQKMLVNAGLKPANENTLHSIASCGRGTARPMERIVDQLVIDLRAYGDKDTINKKDVVTALRLSKMFPLGLEPFEIQLLERCRNQILRDNVIKASMPQVETSQFNHSKGFLMSHGLVVHTTKGLQTTDNGRKYLDETRKMGFELPRV